MTWYEVISKDYFAFEVLTETLRKVIFLLAKTMLIHFNSFICNAGCRRGEPRSQPQGAAGDFSGLPRRTWERLVVNFGWLDVLTRTRGVMDDAVLPVIWAALREGFGSRQ